jgi:Cof subfamily protein (haloacid dehalogenase superfamily)
MKMRVKAVVSDMDGTLLNSNHEISKFSKETVEKIIDKGIKFFIATGRHYRDLQAYVKELSNNRIYMITSNGAVVHTGDGELLYTKSISNNAVQGATDLVSDDSEILINFYDDEKWLAFEKNEYVESYHDKSGFTAEIIEESQLSKLSIVKIYFMSFSEEKLKKLKSNIEEKYGDELTAFFSTPKFLEVVAKGTSKAEAIKVVLEKEKLELNETIAFGDGMNDLEMLSEVGKGILMGNAHAELKEKLKKNEIIGSCDDDSVAKYLTRYL